MVLASLHKKKNKEEEEEERRCIRDIDNEIKQHPSNIHRDNNCPVEESSGEEPIPQSPDVIRRAANFDMDDDFPMEQNASESD